MPTVQKAVDGSLVSAIVPDAQVYWYLGQGYTVTDPTSTPPIPPGGISGRYVASVASSTGSLTVTYSDGAVVTYALAAQASNPTPGGTPTAAVTGVSIDTDGVPYLNATGNANISIDIDGVAYVTAPSAP